MKAKRIQSKHSEIIDITGNTEKKLAEDMLMQAYDEAELRRLELKAVFDNAPIAIWIAHDPHCHEITGNNYANERIMKVPADANISASAKPGDAKVSYKVFRNGIELKPEEMPAQVAVSTRKVVENESLEIRFCDGRTVYLVESAVPIFDKNGAVTGAIITGLDVTLQKKAEEALLESEKKFRELVNYAPVGIYEVDFPARRFISVNDAITLVTGFSREELLSMDIMDLLEEESRAVFQSRITGVLNGEKQHEKVTYKILKKDGGICHAVLSVKFKYNDSGLATRATVVGFDITERIVAERERENLLSNLREAQNKLNIALDYGKIGIWECDLAEGTITWDERTEKMFGINRGGGSKKTFEEFKELVNEDDLPYIQKAAKLSIEEDSPFEILFRPKNIQTKYISAKALLNRNKDGNPASLIGVCSDITGLREGADKLILSLNEELKRSNKELESFAYVASHDLQEPLRMVTSFTQLLSKQYEHKLDEKAKEYIQFAVEGSKRMYDLLNGLLAYSRINTRGGTFDHVELNLVVKNVIRNLAIAIEEKKAVIKTAKLPVVFADENQLIQLFQNLIVNSIKFSKKAPLIHISSKTTADCHIISISDKGIGIEPQYYDRIFQIFQRLFPRGEYEGNGVGLAICKRIVERHGGTIWVESAKGKGTTFSFTIPLRQKVTYSTAP